MRTPLFLTSFLLLAGPVSGQHPTLLVSGEGTVFLAREGLRDSRQQGHGTLVGGEVNLRLKGISLTLGTVFGKLSSDSGIFGERQLRMTQVAIRAHPADWLQTGLRAEAQRTAHGDTVTAWQLYGPTIGLTGGLGVEGLVGTLEGAWFPIQHSHSSDSYSPELQGTTCLEAGLVFTPSRTRVSLELSYRVETYSLHRFNPVPPEVSLPRSGLLVSLGLGLN